MTTKNILGGYTWMAILRDRTNIAEFDPDEPETTFKSINVLADLDVAELHLAPWGEESTHAYIRLEMAPGERIKKCWVRTHEINLDSGEQTELPVVDKFGIQELDGTVHIWLHAFPDGSILISRKPDF